MKVEKVRGVVLKKRRRSALVLTQNGQFARVSLQKEMRLGQEVYAELLPRFPLLQIWSEWFTGTRSLYPKKVLLIGLAALLVLGVGVGRVVYRLSPYAQAEAYVALGAAPNLILTVDNTGHVRSWQVVGNTTYPWLSKIQLNGRSIDTVLPEIMQYAVVSAPNTPYRQCDVMVVTTAPVGKNHNIHYITERTMHDLQKETKIDGKPLLIMNLPMTTSSWQQAIQAKVSPVQLAVVMALTEIRQKQPNIPGSLDLLAKMSSHSSGVDVKVTQALLHPSPQILQAAIKKLEKGYSVKKMLPMPIHVPALNPEDQPRPPHSLPLNANPRQQSNNIHPEIAGLHHAQQHLVPSLPEKNDSHQHRPAILPSAKGLPAMHIPSQIKKIPKKVIQLPAHALHALHQLPRWIHHSLRIPQGQIQKIVAPIQKWLP
ncbi:anti-sigma factor domain-containing protein [Alicyclobacillus sp. TC]|uniref:anti-sigma factor domain-containing protein n=1 Tax=Alicyclobacillus sp. TC TaxID=2606450 RepID=UPI001933EDB0|nr:anti-sigma factor domain-containing protein [Alicyclobacillus sp. TC]